MWFNIHKWLKHLLVPPTSPWWTGPRRQSSPNCSAVSLISSAPSSTRWEDWRFTEDTKRLCELLLTRLFNLRSFPASTHKSSPCWTASWTTGRNGTVRRRSTRPNSKSLRSRKPPRVQLQQVRDAHFGMNVFTFHMRHETIFTKSKWITVLFVVSV